MKKIKYIFALAIAAIALASCVKEDKLSIQYIKTPGDPNDFTEEDVQYYENLRAWKESKHTISYVFFAAWAPPEGSTSLMIEYQTMRPRLISLPDSLDVVNRCLFLWRREESGNRRDYPWPPP